MFIQINLIQKTYAMRKIFVLVVGVTAILGGYVGYRSVTVQRLIELQFANIEALAQGESPVKIPCVDEKSSECKFLTEGADGVWQHLVIKDMRKSN